MPVKAPPRARRIDWSALIFDLERCGLSQRQIAAKCGYEGVSSVNALKNLPGTQPKFHQGALLLGLWMSLTGLHDADVPRS